MNFEDKKKQSFRPQATQVQVSSFRVCLRCIGLIYFNCTTLRTFTWTLGLPKYKVLSSYPWSFLISLRVNQIDLIFVSLKKDSSSASKTNDFSIFWENRKFSTFQRVDDGFQWGLPHITLFLKTCIWLSKVHGKTNWLWGL